LPINHLVNRTVEDGSNVELQDNLKADPSILSD
jgi:hypothetical protein